jgi:hypothetical protein
MALVIKKKTIPVDDEAYVKVIHSRKGVDPDREFDKTQLKEAGYGDKVHRDYAAHYFRWGWAGEFVGRDKVVVEIGCGQDTPLTKVLSGNLSWLPKHYLGVDLNKLTNPFKPKWANYLGQFNFCEDGLSLGERLPRGKADLIVCFEVIEHMKKESGRKLLRNAVSLMDDDSIFLLSTPVYNGKHMAANHLHEYEFTELSNLIFACGLKVERVHGTFATWNAIKKACTEDELALLTELRQFHSWEVLSTFMASKYPQVSSNCAWVLRKNGIDEPPF